MSFVKKLITTLFINPRVHTIKHDLYSLIVYVRRMQPRGTNVRSKLHFLMFVVYGYFAEAQFLYYGSYFPLACVSTGRFYGKQFLHNLIAGIFFLKLVR